MLTKILRASHLTNGPLVMVFSITSANRIMPETSLHPWKSTVSSVTDTSRPYLTPVINFGPIELYHTVTNLISSRVIIDYFAVHSEDQD